MAYERLHPSEPQQFSENICSDEASIQTRPYILSTISTSEAMPETSEAHLEPISTQHILPLVSPHSEVIQRDRIVTMNENEKQEEEEEVEEEEDENDLELDLDNVVLLTDNCLIELQGVKHLLQIDHDTRQVSAIPLRPRAAIQDHNIECGEEEREAQLHENCLDFTTLAYLLGRRGRGRPRKQRDFVKPHSVCVYLLLLSPSPNPALLVQIPIQDIPPSLPQSALCSRVLAAILSQGTPSPAGPAILPVPTEQMPELTLNADIAVIDGSFDWITGPILIPLEKGDPVEDEDFLKERSSRAVEDQLIHCSFCDYETFYEPQLGEHLEHRHVAEESEGCHFERCQKCDICVANKDGLIAHYVRRHPQLVCALCGIIVSQQYLMRKHNERHNVETVNRCEVCGKVYKDRYILREHIKHVHGHVDVWHECDVCGKRFERKPHLVRHRRIHTELIKPFECDRCSYRARERGDLNKHLRCHNEPAFRCGHCDKVFVHLKSLRVHERRHGGQRDFRCALCEFSAFTFNLIKKHIERVHAHQVEAFERND